VTNKGFNRSLFLFLKEKIMGTVDTSLERPVSALAEAYRLANVTPPLGQLAVAVARPRRTPGTGEEAQNARQALQESMDLREQGHAND
jgi:hypothetical protein